MSDNTLERFNALGWHTTSIDGYNLEEVDSALTNAKLDPRPSLISCQTLIGYGAPNKQNTAGSYQRYFVYLVPHIQLMFDKKSKKVWGQV